MKRGYTKAWRKELESDIWKMPPLYHRVFYYLRLKARWKTEIFPTRKIGMWVSPGMNITSIEKIAQGVSYIEYGVERTPNKKTIYEILKWLKSNGMITIESNDKGTTIYIYNWDTYQAEDMVKVTTDIQRKKRTVTNGLDCGLDCGLPTIKEYKTLEALNKKEYTQVFEQFWKAYPSRKGEKVGKETTYNLFKKIKSDEIPMLMKAVFKYANSDTVQRGFAKDPERFLKANFWRDWVPKETSGILPGINKTQEEIEKISCMNLDGFQLENLSGNA